MTQTTLTLEPVASHEPLEIDDQEYDAAVLAPIVERDGEDHLLFTRRSDDLGEHPGQMSFPGGGAEPIDETILETALRESHEEIGLEPHEVEIVGRLDDIRTVSEYAVTPFVGHVPDREYERDGYEVAEIVVLPLTELLDPANYEYEHRDHPYYGDMVIHYFHVDGYTVWGATGRMLVQLLELATDFDASERVDRAE
ncbi:NUDIX hydrolase [Natronorubrum daqingense]|uniref:ADP-ribose pyrophosphatase YjhB, NUDIX family n=1 Tax=Natronorubrum daqingense TaxID=588898 RepID=A0A1N6YRE9_9EURY|nr:CoA pyrophosphatase [Natronorubrum daqingense]APX95590.1 coenzyme A pyrophosphatase [Natronorubrum daqingense]SIR16951.1 ADP-ribose pyrophosphatase YjhB, NUDIX family [Natronorubrum daqingense]